MNNYLLYYGVVISAAIFAYLSQIFAKDKEKEYELNKVFYILSFITFLLFMGFRKCGVGIDDYTYKRIFEGVSNQGFFEYFINSTMEPGYLLLNNIVGMFTNEFQVMIFINAFITLIFIYKAMAFKKKEINFFLAFFIYGAIFYPYSFGITRLGMAYSICFYAFNAFFKNNKYKYIVFILIASLIHYSACIMLLLIFLMEKKIDKKVIKRFYILMIIIVPIIFIAVSKFVIPMLGDRYAGYLLNTDSTFSIGSIDKILIISMSLLFYKNMINIDKNTKVYIILYSITIFMVIYSIIVDFGRIQWYFNIFVCILLPLIVRGISKSKLYYLNVLIVPIILVYCVLYSNKIIKKEAKNVNFDNYSNVFIKGEENYDT